MRPLRVLIVHNRYREAMPSGENIVVDREVELLRGRGLEVFTFFRSNDDYAELSVWPKISASITPVVGNWSARSFRRALQEHQPDVVHVHNVYPLISPTIIDDCGRAGIPVVATVHNFRHRCLRGDFFRDGQICTSCDDRRFAFAGVAHRCYASSGAASAVLAAALLRHRSTWRRVSCFIAVSDFVAECLVSWDFASDRIEVLPNPFADPGPPSTPGDGFVYAARLQREKGIGLLLDAWERSGLDGGPPLYIAGDGPMRASVERRASRMASVEVLGSLRFDELSSVRRRAAVGVQCSLSYEAHPSVGESYALGRPVVATALGGAAGVVNSSIGWQCEPTPESLADALVAASDRADVARKGAAARRHYERTYTPERIGARLEEILRSVAASSDRQPPHVADSGAADEG